MGKEKEEGFHRITLLEKLLPVYFELLEKLNALDVEYIQFDEPCLSLNLTQAEQSAISHSYREIVAQFPNLKVILTNYFDCYGDNLTTVLSLPVDTLHLDLVRCPAQLDDILNSDNLNKNVTLSLGVVDGRNIWKNDFDSSIKTIEKAVRVFGEENVWIASSCSLLHCPYDLALETNEKSLPAEVKQWLAFCQAKGGRNHHS